MSDPGEDTGTFRGKLFMHRGTSLIGKRIHPQDHRWAVGIGLLKVPGKRQFPMGEVPL